MTHVIRCVATVQKGQEVETMRELKASTKAGKEIITRGAFHQGVYLEDVYGSYSKEKERAYDWCVHEHLKTENSYGFHICSHNTFGFTCSWFGVKDGENIMRYETKDNSYLVWLDR